MPTPSAAIINVLTMFAVAFTVPAFDKALLLLYGTILAPGRRTVSAALRAMGQDDNQHFTNYHRLLNRDRWSPWVLSKILLGLLIEHFVAAEAPLIFVIDETLERRQGEQIEYKSFFYDSVRSVGRKVATSLGLRWLCLALLVRVPWSRRPWALPVMTMLSLAPETSAKLGKRHRTLTEWAGFMLTRLRRWQPERSIFVVGDGRYGSVTLTATCQQLQPPIHLVSNLILSAVLHDFPAPQPKSKRGPKPKKGRRLPKLAKVLEAATTPWQRQRIPWYGGERKWVEWVSGVCLWYHRGEDPVPLRWVLLRCPQGSFKSRAVFCSNPQVDPLFIVQLFIWRWNIEVSFEELRAHLGFETQRQWSPRAIERTTPCLFAIFSLVVLLAKVLHHQHLPVREAQWYRKSEATFSDALAAVRMDLWKGAKLVTSASQAKVHLIPDAVWVSLLETVCYST